LASLADRVSTKEIRLSGPGGLGWDQRSFFWGALPLLMVAVFDITGSIDIVLNRLLSLTFGVVVVHPHISAAVTGHT
jgi:hypothetical protein